MTLRLVKAYRGYAAGDRIDVPPQLAARLVRDGLAERVGQDLFAAARPAAERAVAGPARQTRGATR